MLEMWNSEAQARKGAETSTGEWHHKYELSEAFGALLDNFTPDFFKFCRLQFPESAKHFKPLVEAGTFEAIKAKISDMKELKSIRRSLESEDKELAEKEKELANVQKQLGQLEE